MSPSDDDVIFLGSKPRDLMAIPCTTTTTAIRTDGASTVDGSSSRRHSPNTTAVSAGKGSRRTHRLTGQTSDPPRRTNPSPRQSASERRRGRPPPPEIGRRLRSPRKVTVPFEIRNIFVVLGTIHECENSTSSPTVYGFFDAEKGHFCMRRQREGSEIVTRRSLTIPIAHGKVNYKPRFEGMSRRGVQDKVGEYLQEKFGSRLGPGEI
jgi:hypothetical protein